MPWPSFSFRKVITAALWALTFACGLAVLMTFWDWLENPSAIFHNAQGTDWQFVWETAISWWLPGWLLALPVALLLQWRLSKKP